MKQPCKALAALLLLCAVAPLGAEQNRALQKRFSSDEVAAVSVALSSENCIIGRSPDGTLLVEVATNSKKRIPDIALDGGTLRITGKKNLSFRFGGYCTVTVLLPEGKAFDAFAVSTSSGDVTADALRATTAGVTATSGNIALNEGHFSDGRLETTSGDIALGTVTAKTCTVQTTSGNVEIRSFESGSAALTTTSGDSTIGTFSGGTVSVYATSGNCSLERVSADSVHIQTTSGDVDCAFETLPADSAEIKAVSGSVTLSLPGEGGCSVQLSTTSGTVTDRRSGNTFSPRGTVTQEYQGGGVALSVTTTSGAIELQ